MAKPFDVATEAPRFALPLHTREQIVDLMADMGEDARTVVINAIAERHQREIGEPERDIVADVDRILAKLGMTDVGMTDGCILRRVRRV